MNSGHDNTTGSFNTFLGATADVSSSNLSKVTAIGYGAIASLSNSMILGGTGTNQIKAGIGTTSPDADLDIKQDDASGNERGIKLEREDNTDDWRIYTGSTADSDLAFSLNNTLMGVIDGTTGNYVPSSDMRLKKDILALDNVLDKVLQLQPKSYRFISSASDKKAIGFIAQEVELIFPEIVNEREDGFKGLAYDEFAVIAIQAIKEQQTLIQQQQAVINNLLERVAALEQD